MKSNIRRLRNEIQITQTELAHVIGKTQQAVSQMEQDRDRISIEALINMADYFEVSTDYILGLKEERNNPPIREEPESENGWLRDQTETIRNIIESGDSRLLYELVLSLLVCLLKGQLPEENGALPVDSVKS